MKHAEEMVDKEPKINVLFLHGKVFQKHAILLTLILKQDIGNTIHLFRCTTTQ